MAPFFTRSARQLFLQSELMYLAGKYAGPAGVLDRLPDEPQSFYDDHLQAHTRARNNFFRFWIHPYYYYVNPGNAYSPFRRFGLNAWNVRAPFEDGYFTRLERLIRAARKHGVIVQLTIFDAPSLKALMDLRLPDGTPVTRWSVSPWNNARNQNPFLTATDGNGLPEFFDIAAVPGMLAAQKELTQEIARRALKYPNVFYEIM